jgi:hypothetical protein
MPDQTAITKALAEVDSAIFELRVSLGIKKEALVKSGLWNNKRLTLTKPLYNLLERRWALKLLKNAATSTEVLINVRVVGILLPEIIEGAIVPPATRLIKTDVMTSNGLMPMRTYDAVQFEANSTNTQPHELKSDGGKSSKGVLASSVKGGITHPDIEVHLREKSTPGKQIAAEKKLIADASIPGSKIILEGVDAVTGKVVIKHIDPAGLNLSRFHDYNELPDVLTVGKPAPLDPVPDKPATKTPPKKKPKPVIPPDAPTDAADNAAKTKAVSKKRGTKVDPDLKASRAVTPPSPNAAAAAEKPSPTSTKKAPRGKPTPPVAANVPSGAAAKPPAANIDHAPTGAPAKGALVAEATPSIPSHAPVNTPPAPRKGKFSLHLKINPKVKAIGGFVLDIALDLVLGWLENKRIAAEIKKVLETKTDEFTNVVNALTTQEDFAKFRFGSKLENGYQLYFRIELTMTRYCSDGGCGTSGRILDILFKRVTFSRTKGKDFLPDPKDDKDWSTIETIAVFYQPIFDAGIPVLLATQDAADEDLHQFYHTFIARKGGLGDYHRDYYDAYEQYYKYFPNSRAGQLFLSFKQNAELYDVTAVELARKPPIILMRPPYNRPFDQVIKLVRWSLASEMLFIVDYYEIVISLRPEQTVYYLERYDAYFKRMDNGYRKCEHGCHRTTGDKRMINRLTADDVRRDRPSLTLPAGSSLNRKTEW